MKKDTVNNGTDGTEHIMVCLSASPSNMKIIRTAAKMATAFGGHFTALYVKSVNADKMDDFDKKRGKINVKQSLMERIESVRATGLADEIIIEEYEGQKIDDIIQKKVDIFVIGSDWIGRFDYLNEYCDVVYLDRTKVLNFSVFWLPLHKITT